MEKENDIEFEIVNELSNGVKFVEPIEKSSIAKNASFTDQVHHQMLITEDGRSIDLEKKHFEINEEKGTITLDADGKLIASIAKESLTYKNFITTYRESSKKAMYLLLALQSNAAPLKRGGLDIAYMTDLLLDHMIVEFSEEATIVWDALSAMQSSRPEDNAFTLTADDLRDYTNYKSDEALYNAFKKGCNELKKANLEFDVPDPERDGHNIMIHWNDGAEWFGNNKKTGEKAHFDVYTNDFYRVLMTSSGILHGAHWNRRIASSLKGYAKALYVFCARNKNYTKYKGAIPGRREMSVEETRYELKIDKNTVAPGILRRLKEAQDKVNNLPASEFSVNITRVPEKGKITGFVFQIRENRYIDSTAKEVDAIAVDTVDSVDPSLFSELKTLATISKVDLSDEHIKEITKIAVQYNKSAQDFLRIFADYKERLDIKDIEEVGNPVRYIKAMLKNEEKHRKRSKNSFNGFLQNDDYDMTELEKKLLDN